MKNNLRYSSSIDWECTSYNNPDGSFKKRSFERNTKRVNTGRTEYESIDLSAIDFKSALKQNNIKSINSSSIYMGVLFTFVFGFLFFLAVSISYASTNKMKEFDESVLYNKTSGEKLLSDYLFDSGKTKEKNDLKKFKNEKLLLKEYKSVKGDTIESISKKFGISAETIYLTNFIKKRITLAAGTKILIPNQEGRMIVVQKNDSLFRIADRYGVKWEKIVDTNNLQSSVINPKAKIFIPDSKMTKFERQGFVKDKFFIYPVRGIITSAYGLRKDPITGVLDFHTGIDIKNDKGTPVKSVKAGKVVFTGWQKVYGNFIMIKHDNSIITIYGHLDTIDVKKGDVVSQGSFIGRVGDTGRATGAHLHFEVRSAGKIVNPKDFL